MNKVVTSFAAVAIAIATHNAAGVESRPDSIRATGTVEPRQTIEVVAQVPEGRIKSVGLEQKSTNRRIDYGSMVRKNSVLVQLDSDQQVAHVEQAKANLQQAIANLE